MEIKKTTVAIYCRLSEEDHDKQGKLKDSNSIQNQKDLLIEYAKEQDWEIYRIYSDDNYVGSDRKRPDFNRLLQDAQDLKFDIILCKTQSRFTREMELVEKYIHGLFPLWGIRFISIVDHADTASKGNKKARQINGLINEWYLEDMSENIKMVLDNRRKNGYHIGASALYGYQKDPQEKGHLIPDKEAACIVHKIFELYADGYGKTAIARFLNEQKIPSPSVYKSLKKMGNSLEYKGNESQWSYATIDRILRSEMYLGNMVQGKYGSISYKTKKNKPKPKEQWFYVEGTHLPIIEQNLWKFVQTRLAENSKPYVNGKVGILAGKVRCAYCHSSMRTVKVRGCRYYQCSKHHINRTLCQGAFISEEALEQTVFNELEKLFQQYMDKHLIEIWNQKTEKREQKGRLQDKKYDKILKQKQRLQDLEYAIQELYIDKVKQKISEEEYQKFSQAFKKEQLQLQKNLLELEVTKTTMEQKELEWKQQKKTKGEKQDRENLENILTEDIMLKRKCVEILLEKILIGRRESKSNQVLIEIDWCI